MVTYTYVTFYDAAAGSLGFTRPTAINNLGEVVGNFFIQTGPNTGWHPFIYNKGAFTNIFSGEDALFAGVNDSGNVVGSQNFPSTFGYYGAVYSINTSSFISTLPVTATFNVDEASPSSINDAGVIAGSYGTQTQLGGYFLYSNGQYTTFPLGLVGNAIQVGWPVSINNEGQIAWSYYANGRIHGLLSTGTQTVTLDDPLATTVTFAMGINNLGQVVGYYTNATGDHGFVYSGGAYYTIDIGAPVGLIHTTHVTGINDLGQIVGSYFDSTGTEYGFIATLSFNSPPTIDLSASVVTGTVHERPNTTGSNRIDATSGKVAFTDSSPATTTATVAFKSIEYDDASGHAIPLPSQIDFVPLERAFHVGLSNGLNGAEYANWTWFVADKQLDFLGVGETLKITTTITIDDGQGGTTPQDVTVTIHGANDKPNPSPITQSVQIGGTLSEDAAHGLLASHPDPDINDTLTVSAVNGLSQNVGNVIAGHYGSLTLNAHGDYTYQETALSVPSGGTQDVFHYTVSDGHGLTAQTMLTISISPAAPVLVGLPVATNVILQGNRSDPNSLVKNSQGRLVHDNDHGINIRDMNEQWAYDFAVAARTPVNAVAAGTVVYVYHGFLNSQSFEGFGNVVTIKSTINGETFYTTYAHLAGLDLPTGTIDPIHNLSVGESISAGQEIALSGSTGTPGAHLHIQFGTQLVPSINLNSTSHSVLTQYDIADGSSDSVAPAYFQGLTMDFANRVNSSDKFYTGTEGIDLFFANGNGDTIVTNGGADAITLDALTQPNRHSNHVELYGGASLVAAVDPAATTTLTVGVVPARANSIVDVNDMAQGGFWGLTGTEAQFGGLAANRGTSADMSTITNFKSGAGTGTDFIDFSVKAWGSGGTNAQFGTNQGLIGGDLGSHPASSAGGTNMVFAAVTVAGTVGASVNVLELTGQFANADAVAQALHTTYKITFAGVLANNADAHVLVAYNDTTGYGRIADLELSNTSGVSTGDSTLMTEYASDMVQLIGVSVGSLAASNVHFVS